MLELSEDVVRAAPAIVGPHSAAANALKDAETRRARGEVVTFFKERGRLIVRGVQPAEAAALARKEGQ